MPASPVAWQGDRTAAGTSSVSFLPVSTGSSLALLANPERNGAFFFNDASSACFLKFGEGAATRSFTVRMRESSYFELPWPIYYGAVSIAWAPSSGTGGLAVTETQGLSA